ncbi:MAG: hypothetical protein K1X67_01615 [Fimbriimonadaceae bacterium]|nr:hypothetical protein [Fimbriimonadaceae bacterium]
MIVEQYLAEAADRQVSEVLVAAVNDHDKVVRQTATRFISSDTVSSCVPALADAISKFPGEETGSIFALRRVATPEAFAVIRSLATNSKSQVREMVAATLRGDSTAETKEVLKVLSRDKSRWVAMTALASSVANGYMLAEGRDEVTALLAFANSMSGSNRLDAWVLLTRTKSVLASALLARVIATAAPEDQMRLVFEVRYLPREKSLSNTLLSLCKSGSDRLRSYAISTLALQAEPRVLPIVERFSNSSELVDWASAFALRKLKARSGKRMVELSMLQRPTCYEALIGLTQSGVAENEYAQVKQKLLSDSTADVPLRMMAAYVLRNIDKDWAATRLKELERDWNRDVRMIALTGFMIRDFAGPPGRAKFEESLPFYWVF